MRDVVPLDRMSNPRLFLTERQLSFRMPHQAMHLDEQYWMSNTEPSSAVKCCNISR